MSASASTPSSAPAAAVTPWRVSTALLPSHGALSVGALSNGLRYAVRPASQPPNRVLAWLEVGVGSSVEANDEQGIAHFLEHCVFLGTGAHPDQEAMLAVFTSLGMSFGGDANAVTDLTTTTYTLEAPLIRSAPNAPAGEPPGGA